MNSYDAVNWFFRLVVIIPMGIGVIFLIVAGILLFGSEKPSANVDNFNYDTKNKQVK